jgi:hypothetical protein
MWDPRDVTAQLQIWSPVRAVQSSPNRRDVRERDVQLPQGVPSRLISMILPLGTLFVARSLGFPAP